jgi:cytochrome b561
MFPRKKLDIGWTDLAVGYAACLMQRNCKAAQDQLETFWPADGHALGKSLNKIHEAIATAGYLLVGMHAAVAMFHHSVKRDYTLRLMMPAR